MSSNDPNADNRDARLLVVDDNEDNRYTLIMRLQIEGYENITTADDGEAALALLDAQEFDLVLLDVMMPKLDGYQVLTRLKAEGRLHNVPVIMISALTEIDSVVRCIELGAVDYLAKPFDPVLLRARVGASIEKKRLRDEVRAYLARMEEDLKAARELQLSMVPTQFPQPTAARPIEIFAMMEPAREVGGDLYDFYDMDDGRLCFLIGDVAGKGTAAALFMARTKNVIRLLARLLRGADDAAPLPADIITAANQELCQDNTEMMFVTLFFGLLDPRTGDLQFANAGHNPPYHLTPKGAEPISEPKGRPLGMQRESAYKGEAIYLYTDGITEAANRKDELFTEQRLEAILRGTSPFQPKDVIKAVADAVGSFADSAPQSDDITAMAIRLFAISCKV